MARSPGPGDGQPRRLMRSRNRKLGGVCGGVAEYLDLDPTIVRVVFVVLLLFPFFPLFGGLLLYFVLWMIMPERPADAGDPFAVEPAPEASSPTPSSASPASSGGGVDGRLVLGGALLVFGVLLLLQRTLFIWWPGWWLPSLATFAWPVLLMAIGALILFAALNRRG